MLTQGSLTEYGDSVQLTSLYKTASFSIENVIYLFTKQATLMRRSSVLSHPLQLAFPGLPFRQVISNKTDKIIAKLTGASLIVFKHRNEKLREDGEKVR